MPTEVMKVTSMITQTQITLRGLRHNLDTTSD